MGQTESTPVQFNVTPHIVSVTPKEDGRARSYVWCSYTDSSGTSVPVPLVIPPGGGNQVTLNYIGGPDLQLAGALWGTQGTNAAVSPGWTPAAGNQVTIPPLSSPPAKFTDVILVFSSTTGGTLLYASSDPQIQNDNA